MSPVVRVGPVSARPDTRLLVTTALLGGAAVAVGLVALSRGATWSAPSDVLAAFVGGGRSPVVVLEWRLPRVAAAWAFGAGLGLAGAVFQNLTRNPLGSPDVIGLDSGAYTGTLVVLTVAGGAAVGLTAASITGGALTAALVLALAAERRGATTGAGLRLVVVGIAVNAMLTAVNSWIVLRAELEVAMAGTGWSAGSLNGVGWPEVGPAIALLVVLAAALALLGPAMHQIGLGDGVAVTTGVHVARLRRLLVAVGVATSAAVTAVAGPIMFVALTAPQIGRRLAGAAGVPLAPAAATGALLLVSADLVAQVAIAPAALPVGVVTTAVGGAYLIWLLAREVRR